MSNMEEEPPGNLDPFKHHPLLHQNQVRLLELDPRASTERRISGTMRIVSLDDMPRYHALSYTWGEPLFSQSIVCNGQVLFVTANLRDAMLRLLKEQGIFSLWIDAVCIDQLNIAERSHQVRLMQRIFQQAEKVFVWLGPEAEHSAEAIKMISKLAQVYATDKILRSAKEYIQQLDQRPPLTAIVQNNQQKAVRVADAIDYSGLFLDPKEERDGFPPIDSSKWDAIKNLFQRPWFRRVWIIQEVCFARQITVICGNGSLSWTELMDAARCVKDCFRPGPCVEIVPSLYFIDGCRTRIQRRIRVSLLQLLNVSHEFESTDPRDKVYALLGLDRHLQHGHPWLVPDYSIALSEVYRRTTKYLLCSRPSPGINVLAATRIPRIPGAEVPSWVPDWSLRGSPAEFRNPESESWYCAANGSTGPYDFFESDPNALGILGKIVDSVKITLPTVPADHPISVDSWNAIKEVEKRAEVWQEWKKQAATDKGYPTGETEDQVFWRTIVADCSEKGYERAPISFRSSYNTFFALLSHAKQIIETSNPQYDGIRTATGILELQTDPEIRAFYRELCRATNGHQLCLTEKGYMGLVPPQAEPGDIIAVLRGGDVPFVLRKGEGCHDELPSLEKLLAQLTQPSSATLRPRVHHVIGSCFVHGIMGGEAWRDTAIRFCAFILR